jgi:uncharacterized protein GlcG (DUF336 family)
VERTAFDYHNARALIDRAVDKAESFGLAGAFYCVDAGGAPLSGSRMAGVGGSNIGICRAKAYAAAVNREPSARFGARMAAFPPGLFGTYERILPDPIFPAGGGMMVLRDGETVAGFSTGGAIGPFAKLPSVAPSRLLVNGQPTNVEDLIVSYALGGEYSAQHGDDVKRWVEAYGAPPDETIGIGTGLDPAPTAVKQEILQAARVLASMVMERAPCPVAVVVLDQYGDLVQIDRDRRAPPIAADVAHAAASAAFNLRCSSAQIGSRFGVDAFAAITTSSRTRLAAVPGAAPLLDGDDVTGAIGLFGALADLAALQAVADEVAAQSSKIET